MTKNKFLRGKIVDGHDYFFGKGKFHVIAEPETFDFFRLTEKVRKLHKPIKHNWVEANEETT